MLKGLCSISALGQVRCTQIRFRPGLYTIYYFFSLNGPTGLVSPVCNNDCLFFKELFQLISLTWRNVKKKKSPTMQTRPSGMKSAPRLVPFRKVTRCDIGVSATGSLPQLCVQKTPLFSFLCVHFLTCAITPVISIDSTNTNVQL